MPNMRVSNQKEWRNDVNMITGSKSERNKLQSVVSILCDSNMIYHDLSSTRNFNSSPTNTSVKLIKWKSHSRGLTHRRQLIFTPYQIEFNILKGSGPVVNILLLDLRKTFDSVVHTILLLQSANTGEPNFLIS